MKIAFTKIEKPPLAKMSMGFAILSILVMLILLIFFSCFKISWTNMTNEKTFQNIKIMLIILFTLGLIFSILIAVSWFLADLGKIIDNKMQFILLSIISFSFINIVILFYLFHKNKTNKQKWKITWKFFGWKKFSIYEIVLGGVFTALTIVFAYLEQFMPGLVIGVGLTFKYVILIVIGVVISPILAICVGITAALLSILFVGPGHIISPWSFLLDYFVPMMMPGIVSLLRFTIKPEKSYINYLNYIIIGFLNSFGVFISQTISGIFVWTVLISVPNWGANTFLYSIIINTIHVWPLTYPLTQILIIPAIKVASLISKNKLLT
ncbi:energy-coupled thiamine transporter ThiT [Williamsoniiplasma lucivorax]|uniref:Thiamine transporter n=1 Tax=Williamsoniiplasma lucivorax TaxID=209274 RepID=A0A2S5RFT4_9MOLU|nr:energy-coupled thiamine transporter ThiT [Williamsoniiplasma lucivorax]PPE05995.1 thiamine transporter [Williamsoniiplasma lucivorax]